MSKLIVLSLKTEINNEDYIVHPVVLESNNFLILFDTGFINSFSLLESAFIENNLDITKLSYIFITHHDHDHIANLADIKQKLPNVIIYASEIEAQYIEKKITPIRLQQALKIQAQLPDNMKEWGLNFIELLKKVKSASVDQYLHDNQDIIIEDEVIISITTPGHLDGHLSFYLPHFKALIAGDALILENNQLKIAEPQFAINLEQAKQSALKLFNYNFNTIICYHGGRLIDENLKNKLNIT